MVYVVYSSTTRYGVFGGMLGSLRKQERVCSSREEALAYVNQKLRSADMEEVTNAPHLVLFEGPSATVMVTAATTYKYGTWV